MNQGRHAKDSSLVSVIIPCWNALKFTRHCVRSIVAHTHRPFEIIVVDNGSTDGTFAYFDAIADIASFPMKIVRNETNQGFPVACNQGIRQASGEFVLLLNNDVVVTDGWLDQLTALLTSQDRFGAVGPMSNYVSPPQLVPEVAYESLNRMHDFAARWRDSHRGQWFTTSKLSGFCILFRRSAIERIGLLDESFGLGFFDDDDISRRLVAEGYELTVAHDLFVHHFGSRTFAEAGIDTGALLAENQRKFAEKWNLEPDSCGTPVTLSLWNGSDAIANEKAKVSLTMIVRDEESNLAACLESVHGLFDEMIVVDTGSKDATKRIAQDFGAKVFDFPWIDDFAAARNEALRHATGEYAFWLDADDRVDASNRDGLRALFDRLSPTRPAAFVLRCACDATPDGQIQGTVVDHMRLFPLRHDIRWTYPVHEQILPALRRVGVPVEWTDIVIRHTGYVDEAVRSRKLDRDSRILERILAESPNEPFVRFNLGFIAVEKGEWAKALEHFLVSLAHSEPEDSITRKLYALIAKCRQSLGRPDEAVAVCDDGLRIAPDDAELLYRKAVALRTLGARDEAESCWNRILTLKRPERFSSVDVGIYGHLTRRNLARIAEEKGDTQTAMRLWENILEEYPDDAEANTLISSISKVSS